MNDDDATVSDESAAQPGRNFDSSTPTAREASSKALGAAIFVLILLVVGGTVWWFMGQASAAGEADAATRLEQLGAYVQRGRDQRVTSVHLLKDPQAAENMDEIVAQLPALSRLSTLNGLGAPVTDEHLATIGQIGSLEALLLQNTDVTDAGMPHLTGLDNLLNLDLNGTGITDKGLESVGRIHSLKNLNIGDSNVAGDLSELSELQNLEWLLLPNMKLSDGIVDTLAGLGHLSHLSINGSTISDAALAELRKKKPNMQIDR